MEGWGESIPKGLRNRASEVFTFKAKLLLSKNSVLLFFWLKEDASWRCGLILFALANNIFYLGAA